MRTHRIGRDLQHLADFAVGHPFQEGQMHDRPLTRGQALEDPFYIHGIDAFRCRQFNLPGKKIQGQEPKSEPCPVKTQMRRYAQHPGIKGFRRSEIPQLPPGDQQGILYTILRFGGSDDRSGKPDPLFPVHFHQRREGIAVTGPGLNYQYSFLAVVLFCHRIKSIPGTNSCTCR